MKLSDTEKKILMLAMDRVASDGEIAAAASRFFHSLRKRYKNGLDLIKDMESWDAVQQPMPAGANPFASPFGGVSMTRPFGQAPPNPVQPQRAPPPNAWQQYDFNAAWQDIMWAAQRQAEDLRQRQYQQHAAAFAAQQQANAHAATKEHQEWAKEQLKKKPPSIWKTIFGK